MSNQLVTKGSRHTRQNKTPTDVFKHALMALLKEIVNIIHVALSKLSGTKRHIAKPAGDLDNILGNRSLFGCEPSFVLHLQKLQKRLVVKVGPSNQK